MSQMTAPTPALSPQTQNEASDLGGRRLERQLFVALLGGTLLLVSAVAHLLGASSAVADIPAAIGAILLLIPLLKGAIREMKRGEPSSDALATLAVIAAIAVNDLRTAGFLALFLWLSKLVLSRTAWGAQRAIRELVELTPDAARRLDENGVESEVKLADLKVGDIVRIRPGENLPVDGCVVTGSSSINQASLTGEAVPIEAMPGIDVYAGTTNLTGQIDVTVTAVADQTTIGKVESLIREAESARSDRQDIIERLAGFYVPVVIMVSALVWFFTVRSPDRDEAAIRAITVLVVTCPGALLIAYPTAMVAAFASAARLGIMIKQTRTLENAAVVDTVVMDKTGTLTTGQFAVSRLAPVEGVDGATLLQAAADAEQSSNHPLARSILDTAKKAKITAAPITDYIEVHGRGVRATREDGVISAGRGAWLRELSPGIADQVTEVEEKIAGMSSVHVMLGDRYLGAVGLEDKLRRNASEVVQHLRRLGVRRICIFTGDRLDVAKRVGQSVGVDSVEAECLPEEKHAELKNLIANGHRTLVVGDGINDGPILATADVGVAMGLSGSDIATNSAGVALMHDDLRHVPFLLEIARRTKGIITQNIAVSLLLAVVGLALAATGNINIWLTPFYQAVAYLFVILNSLRLVRFGEDFAEDAQARRDLEAERERLKSRSRDASVRLARS
ncbi:MAG: cation-translocating P-type ATPase [Planctomycetota bacterium]|nr:cation-translocating P-type ATPase [Planctomycetota bacterium]MDA1025497.1 cation-translocating P-type ATPase [Planctomycetota bacterium]